MATTIALALPLPGLNGAGAAVDVSAIGGPLTFTAVGSFPGATIAVEASNDGGLSFSPVFVFQSAGGERVVPIAAQWVRVNVAGRKSAVPFSADCDVAGPTGGGSFAILPLPAANGAGAAVDASGFDRFCTFICTGSFAGAAISVQISEDNLEWSPVTQFTGRGGIFSQPVSALWMRAFVAGRKTAVPFSGGLSVGAVELAGPQGLAGIDVADEGVVLGTFTELNFVGPGVTVTDAGGGISQISIPGATADTKQVFEYIVTGLEANPFPVALPAVRASANYNVQLQSGGPVTSAFKDYRPLQPSFANNTFNVECAVAPEANDILMFTVEDLT